ncbi:nuclear transport factor 2 family protein [Croceicoccus bisphenolivorans]|uniref:nuclear transport factor 2 family protein n=1 Tax=Croceicoccus bisphenolivorans TaxID=1783232 RepID=UPI0008314AAF|nr:nuclear transport factor 2 family protein [Croceicoccus bisphenolivorans]
MYEFGLASADALAVVGVWNEYARCLDRLDYDALLELCTPDVSWSSIGFGGAQGAAEVREFFKHHESVAREGGEGGRPVWAHVMANPSVAVDGNAAVGKFYLTAYKFEGADRTPVVARLSDYRVEFVRLDGCWRIKTIFMDDFPGSA